MNKQKLLIISIFCVLESLGYAQKISVDRIEGDGRHQIMTSTRAYVIDGVKYNFGMKIYEGTRNIDWLLLISSFSYISSSTEVLLKLGNNEILYLPCNNVHVGTIHSGGYGIPIGTITYYTPPSENDYYSSVYELTKEQLDKMAEHGVKKIRISTGTTYRDKSFPAGQLGKYLVKCRKKIQKRLDNPITKKGLYDDF